MAAPTPQQRKVTALENALGAARKSQADAKAAGQAVKSPTATATPPGKP